MQSVTKETFKLDSIELKTLSDFQNILFSMRDCAEKKNTQSSIESIYNSLNELIENY